MKIKVCGMRQTGNIREIAELEPDFMGFIFYKRSPRFVGEDFVMPELPETMGKIGVFVKEPLEELLFTAHRHGLDGVQLHSDETPEYGEEVRRNGLKVLKAFAVDAHFDFEQVKAYEGKVDFLLFDTKGEGYGGHGKVFDWTVLARYGGDTPFLVAGGISNDNLGELLQLQHPMWAGVDINSRYEMAAGVKDVQAVAEAISKVRSF